MNKLLLFVSLVTVFIYISSSTVVVSAGDSYGVGLWNNGSSVSIGIVNYSRRSTIVPSITIPNINFISNANQMSTYNYQTKSLVFIANVVFTNQYVMINVNCTTWKVISKYAIPQTQTIFGLSSDSSQNGSSVFTASSYGDGYIYLNKIDPVTMQVYTFDIFPAIYRGSVFDPSKQMYYFCYAQSQQLNVTLCKEFNSDLAFNGESQFNVTNSKYPVVPAPVNMMYNPTTQTITCNLQMTFFDNTIAYYLTEFDYDNNVFNVIQNTHLYSTNVVSAPDSYGLRLIYTVSYFANTFSLWTFDTKYGYLLQQFPLSVPLLAIF